MSKPVPVLLGLLLLAGLLTGVAYILGRDTCPPPTWWMALFSAGGNFGCVV